jgi:RecB family exonuclease
MSVLTEYGLTPKPVRTLDSSMLSDFARCPSLFYLRHVLGLRKKLDDPTEESHFDWGRVWHDAMEVYYENFSIEEAIMVVEENFPPHINPSTDRHGRSKERMLKDLFEYANRWEEIDKTFEIIRLEQFFEIESDEHDLRWCGRIDQIRRSRTTGKVIVLDHKTSSRMGSTYWDGLKSGFQFPGYVFATNEMFTESVTTITGDVYYNIKSGSSFFRRSFVYTPGQLYEWADNVRSYVEEIYRLQENHLHNPEAWQKNRTECVKYGKCSYFDVHDAPPQGDLRLKILTTQYEEERWDPLRKESD